VYFYVLKSNKLTEDQAVDRLLFLKYRASKFGYSSSFLVSSQSGFINFYNFNNAGYVCGTYEKCEMNF